MPIEKERFSENLRFPWWIEKEHRARYIFASQFTENAIVIDCASGTGEGSFLFSKNAQKVIGVDISSDALREASNRFQGENLSFLPGSALDIPAPREYADVYVSLETIEHLEDDRAYLREAVRVLKDHGIFICSTPNRTVTNPGKSLTEKPCNPFHVREYSTQEFIHLLQNHFKSVELYGLNKNNLTKIQALDLFARLFSKRLATRLHQSLKLLSFFFKKNSSYTVQKVVPQYEYEYLIAVCRK